MIDQAFPGPLVPATAPAAQSATIQRANVKSWIKPKASTSARVTPVAAAFVVGTTLLLAPESSSASEIIVMKKLLVAHVEAAPAAAAVVVQKQIVDDSDDGGGEVPAGYWARAEALRQQMSPIAESDDDFDPDPII
jgi:hypothetical protein